MIVTLRQLKQVSGYFSMPEITPAVFVKYMRYPFTVGFTPLSILLLLVFCALILRYFFIAARSDAYRLTRDVPINHFIPAYFLIYYCVLLFGTVVSKVMTANIFVDRYLFFAIGLLWLFFAIEAGTLQKPLVYGILILELLTGIAGFLQAYQSEYAGNAEELIAFLEENVKPGDQLYTLEDAEGLSLSLPFYDDALTNVESPDDLDPDKTIWCAILTGYDYSPKELDGFSLEPVGDFAFDRYQFFLYKMTENQQK